MLEKESDSINFEQIVVMIELNFLVGRKIFPIYQWSIQAFIAHSTCVITITLIRGRENGNNNIDVIYNYINLGNRNLDLMLV